MRTTIAAFFICVFLVCANAHAATVYENQEPIQEKELLAFIAVLPDFRVWANTHKEEAYPKVTQGKADFAYSDKAAQWVTSRGWNPDRFFSVMGKAAAALFIVAEGSEVTKTPPPDMPMVTQAELNLVRTHFKALLESGRDAPPINQ